MGRKSKLNKRAIKRKARGQKVLEDHNFVAEAGKGCYIVRQDDPGNIIEFERIDPFDFEENDVPDIAFDPDTKSLSVCNVDNEWKVAYVTIYDTQCVGRDKRVFETGTTTNNDGETSSCTTFIVLCPATTFVHLCYLNADDVLAVRIESDVQEWNKHPSPDDTHHQLIGFPLSQGTFLCTQGEDGHLTHFFSGNLHALDFRCPVGTPLLAVGDGVVVQSKTNNSLTGIAVSNLFEWNSILLRLDNESDPLFVEYVHIESSNVTTGQKVKLGDIIGFSGSVGFSPEPHLHFAAYRRADTDAATVRVQFAAQDGSAYLPKAGFYYSQVGPSTEQRNGPK
mmetsp:Transcript_32791/g.48559  ORF Transcript_32791/g.48559 Transcript_32791/m.48559 type:complete len:337 (-) Transcript_32791:56-1066(-)